MPCGSVSDTITPNAAPALFASSVSLPAHAPFQLAARLHSHKMTPHSRPPWRTR